MAKAKAKKSARQKKTAGRWEEATDEEGYVYYWHTVTKKTKWDPEGKRITKDEWLPDCDIPEPTSPCYD